MTAPYLKLGAVQREDSKALALLAVNRSLDEVIPIEIVAQGFGKLQLLATGHTDGSVAGGRYNAVRIYTRGRRRT